MKQIFLILILGVAFVQAQTTTARVEKPGAKLLVLWQAKNCRVCQTKIIDGQEFQIIADDNATLAFHGGAGADFLVGDVYVLNKSRRAVSFDPEKDVAVSAWTDAKKRAGGAEILRPLTAEEALLKTPRPEFWSGVVRAMGGRRAVNKTERIETILLKAERLAPNESAYGTIYFPRNEAHEAIGFNVTVGDRIYSFSFGNPKNNLPAPK